MRMHGDKSLYIGIGGSDMTIDEAVENLKYDIEIDMYIRDIAPQLAEWLEELKKYKEKPEGYLWDEAVQQGYNKAIDDFVNACKEDILCQTSGLHANGIERIAEQLKAGGQNEQG